MPDVGELVVGAWLTQVENYDFVIYNKRPGAELPAEIALPGPAGVAAQLSELDVIGLNTPRKRSYLAECTTWLDGMTVSKSSAGALARWNQKFRFAAGYASVLQDRTGLEPELAFWSPKVSKAFLDRSGELQAAAGGKPIDLVVNDAYSDRVVALIERASARTTMTGNDFYRTLQLLTHLARSPFIELPARAKRQVAEAAAEMVAAAADSPVLSWDEVYAVHRTRAGIRAPRGGIEASIICNTGPHGPYPDRFLTADVMHYVGRGIEGDQELDRDNESLRQAIERGVPIRMFEQLGKNRYTDHGLWLGVGDPLWHIETGSNRRLVVFTLQRIAASI